MFYNHQNKCLCMSLHSQCTHLYNHLCNLYIYLYNQLYSPPDSHLLHLL